MNTAAAQILELCPKALGLAPVQYPPDLAPSEGNDYPEWHDFEWAAWELGENIRQLFKDNLHLRGKPELLAAVVEVIECRNLRRGRQSFFMSLEHVRATEFAETVSRYLSDDDVSGHALCALLGMKAWDYGDEVCKLAGDSPKWVQQKAKRYLERSAT